MRQFCSIPSTALIIAAALVVLLSAPRLRAQESKSSKYKPQVVAKAEKVLEDVQLRRSGKTIQATATNDLARAISGMTRKKRELRILNQEWKQVGQQVFAIGQELKRLNAQYGELNLKLARVADVDAGANNRIVGLINATNARIKAVRDQRDQAKEELAKRRSKTESS